MRFLNITTPVCLLLAALSTTATACDGYLFCHCYNSDGKPNDVATETVCNRFAKEQSKMIDANQWSDGARECRYAGPEFTPYDRTRPGGNVKAYGFGNCDWRVMCQEAGATGKDSSCRDTPPEGPKSLNSIYIVGHS
ncbi:hypothetical protein CGCSCA4_v006918 [Colletotrichum siamense]|uniref:Secreted protein n=1 Tax=Colletotrichum siamense TaxID=690259 RepID=A0A9P5EUQ4_COLSI|nr:hypothetical protein CGCSCA4_v006918 [Colletotrichum siamense]KAF4859772.1 hypothetical protein CGCSCA2_v006021 [Colletotrichum siamense]